VPDDLRHRPPLHLPGNRHLHTGRVLPPLSRSAAGTWRPAAPAGNCQRREATLPCVAEAVMERTLTSIEADHASLRANAVKFRQLAQERRAVDQLKIADKLMELVSELEARAAELEAQLRPASRA